MTIAAGFRFEMGTLLCADTQYSSGAKTFETKIFEISHGAATLVLALSGRYLFAKRAVERIEENIKAIPKDELSKGRMQDGIETALRFIYDKHVYTHPDWGTDDAPSFDFVIGLYSPIDGDFLLATDETLTAEMADHVCLGSGSYLGDYLSSMYIGKSQPMEEVLSLAIYILQQTKSYDVACGGTSEFVRMWDDGDISPIETFDVTMGERYSEIFPKIVRPLFYALADLDMKDEELQPLLDRAMRSMKRYRTVLKATKEFNDRLLAALSRKRTAAP